MEGQETPSSLTEENIRQLLEKYAREDRLFVKCNRDGEQKIEKGWAIWPISSELVSDRKLLIQERFVTAECPKCGSTLALHVAEENEGDKNQTSSKD